MIPICLFILSTVQSFGYPDTPVAVNAFDVVSVYPNNVGPNKTIIELRNKDTIEVTASMMDVLSDIQFCKDHAKD